MTDSMYTIICLWLFMSGTGAAAKCENWCDVTRSLHAKRMGHD